MKPFFLLIPILAGVLCIHTATAQEHRTYTCYRATGPIRIDGKLNEADWEAAPLSEAFVDIRGVDYQPAPAQDTWMKMLWDDECLYIAGILRETDVTASLTERDAIIYRDNDFEVFIDPEGDGKAYFEFECNAFGTLMDLLMDRPYFRGGSFFLPWDCRGVRLKVHVDGKINDNRRPDLGWTVEMAIPFVSLTYGSTHPKSIPVWRINFSRVQWMVKEGPEENWVWNPTGKVNMHMPENWGYLKLIDEPVRPSVTKRR
ncbi:MAG: carbohydrate-binding family 9-like protein [Bacteroidales bacterium]|nr:carbohydrate-binding family 9-like protein [Bacteroidales bacterium]